MPAWALQFVIAGTIGAVAEFVDDYAKPSAMRVFRDAALPPVELNAATLARYIQLHRLGSLNARELSPARSPRGLREAEPLNEALAFLVEAHWLSPDGRHDRGGSTLL